MMNSADNNLKNYSEMMKKVETIEKEAFELAYELQNNIQKASQLLSYEDVVRSLHQTEAVKDKLLKEMKEETEAADIDTILEEAESKIILAQNTSAEMLRFIENVYKDLQDIDKEFNEKE